MTRRTITIEPFYEPGGTEARETQVTFQLVDLSGSALYGYRSADNEGISGPYAVAVDGAAQTVDLTPNDAIYPASAWKITVSTAGQRGRSTTVQLATADLSGLTLPELLGLDTETDYWDIYQNQLLPDPTDAANGSALSVSEGEWIISSAPAGSGDMQALIYDPAGRSTNVFALENQQGVIDTAYIRAERNPHATARARFGNPKGRYRVRVRPATARELGMERIPE